MVAIQTRTMAIRDETPEIPTPVEEIDITLKPESVTGAINIGSKIKVIRGLGVGEPGTVINIQGDYYQIELPGAKKVDVRKEDLELLSPDSTTESFDYRMYQSESDQDSLPYAPVSPAYVPSPSAAYIPGTDSPVFIPNVTPEQIQRPETSTAQIEDKSQTPDILAVPEKSEDSKEESELQEQNNTSSDSGEKKTIELENNSGSEIKKINI